MTYFILQYLGICQIIENEQILSGLDELPEVHFEFLNRQIIAHTQVLVHRWGPRRIGIPALFHRQTYSLVSSVVQAKLLDCCYGFMSKFVTSADIILL